MRYGEVLPPGFKVPFGLGADMRKNPFQAMTIREGDVAMDCGACWGTWSIAVLREGARRVVAYEPEAKNFLKLQGNLREFGEAAHLVMAALVSFPCPRGSRVDLNTGFPGSHTIVTRPEWSGRPKVSVPALNFRDEILRLQPTVVKVDIEGAEYDLFSALQPGDLRSVQSLFIEFHSNNAHKLSPHDPGIKATQEFVRREGLFAITTRLKGWIAERPKRRATPTISEGLWRPPMIRVKRIRPK